MGLSDPRTAEATFDLLGKAEGHFNRVAVQPLQLLEADALPEQFVKAAMDSNETIAALSAATEAKDPHTQGHTVRVAELAVSIAQKMQLSTEQIQVLARAGILHDIGKMGIPDSILLKPGPLTPEEFDISKRHPMLGLEILRRTGSLEREWKAIQSHHEKVDGTGYPDGLKGEEIPLEGRILSVADVYDSLVSDRPYRAGMSQDKAVEILTNEAGSHLDPTVVQMLLQHLDRASG